MTRKKLVWVISIILVTTSMGFYFFYPKYQDYQHKQIMEKVRAILQDANSQDFVANYKVTKSYEMPMQIQRHYPEVAIIYKDTNTNKDFYTSSDVSELQFNIGEGLCWDFYRHHKDMPMDFRKALSQVIIDDNLRFVYTVNDKNNTQILKQTKYLKNCSTFNMLRIEKDNG